ncbi:Ragulator complex protein LAMTOR3 [Umbelopsis sp. PMI_123]|nr:Ragulator complex protein LAMTOR3 [Umbelopsis sp. PMI_123]
MSAKESFQQLVQPYFEKGLKAALLTDREGVVVLEYIAPDAPAGVMDPSLSTAFSIANNQASKMGLKKNKSIIGVYGLHQVIQIDCYPLIISLVADATANTGVFLDFGDELQKMVEPMVAALQDKH